jgi:hypothetical protein
MFEESYYLFVGSFACLKFLLLSFFLLFLRYYVLYLYALGVSSGLVISNVTFSSTSFFFLKKLRALHLLVRCAYCFSYATSTFFVIFF